MTRRASTSMVGVGVVSVVAIAIAVTSAQQPALAPAPFTIEQATAGRAAYLRECAGCHRPDLRGSGEASPLSGPNFMSAWGDRSIAELYTRIQGLMPPERAGALADAEYLGIVAHILQANGARGSGQPLTTSAAAQIRTLASGASAAVPAAQGPGSAPPGGGGGGRGGPPARPRGITLPGEVANYVPVTAAMLENPPGHEWLMVRRTYQAWNDSPLDQITAANVKNLRLAWTWAMADGPGRNQPTPLVHGGVMYLLNVGHVVQALNAQDGRPDLGAQPWPGARPTALRNMAIYDDKLFLATNDARLVAINARNGQLVWETRIADSARAT